MMISASLKTIYLVFYILISCKTSQISQKRIDQPDTSGCLVKKGVIEEPIKPVDYFKKELADFKATGDYDFQFIYLDLPGNDDVGSIVYCRLHNNEISLMRAKSNEERNFIIQRRGIKEYFEKVETGGYYQLCESKKSFDDFSICMIKKKSEIIFQYQGINAGIDLLSTDTTLSNVIRLYGTLAQ